MLKNLQRVCVILIIGLVHLSVHATASHHSLQSVAAAQVKQQQRIEDFDWNNSATLLTKAEATSLENLLTTYATATQMSDKEKLLFASLNYKLGTYYTHVAREPDLAISKLTLAESLFKNKKDKAWTYNHLAYAYELKYANSRQSDDKQKALYFSNRVISKYQPNTPEIAFAYCVKGLVFNDAYDYAKAETNFKNALKIYEEQGFTDNEQYARAKTRLASIILNQHGREAEVFEMLKPIKKYWLTKGNMQKNPFAARTLIISGQAYLAIGNGYEALKEFKQALAIYKQVYGVHDKELSKPYDLISQAYQLMGKKKQAIGNGKKAIALKILA